MSTLGADEELPILRMLPMWAMGGCRTQMRVRYDSARRSLRSARDAFEDAANAPSVKRRTIELAEACRLLVAAFDARAEARLWRPS